MDPLARLAAHARASGLPWTEAASAQLDAYLRQLVDGVPRISTTAARSVAEATQVLAWPACAVGSGWDGTAPPARIADIGSGNGFPGVVAAMAWPEATVALIERRERKAQAMAKAVEAAGLMTRVSVLAVDAREVATQHPTWLGTCDLVTARAVGALGMVNRLAAPLLREGGLVLHWKAHDMSEAEREDGARRARGAGLMPLPDLEFEPGPPGPGRLVRYRRGSGLS